MSRAYMAVTTLLSSFSSPVFTFSPFPQQKSSRMDRSTSLTLRICTLNLFWPLDLRPGEVGSSTSRVKLINDRG
ncbi:hypothetical protein K437DRAFT_96855 [Tilletiaria anomala UBC 951]|uniref:Uncharacterized protein n=1 Tax=Tilletiaria anomala (strain ATCC 24038 / CBS 436.72 / UBC 951) TaxID=1037660 RepID=A0A066WRH0_TILAU|nr:uncharacterized protein K437DRAFT_96855 [Tilletiaria anomala UBC 951]KDN53260.1 hypothetical protein K437DRAFT_96855 [Tilletiaria anomala UBC 951]